MALFDRKESLTTEVDVKSSRSLSVHELHALPVSVDLPTAGRAFGMGRTTAYELARRGEFPVPVLPFGARFRVNRSDLFRALGVTEQDVQARPA